MSLLSLFKAVLVRAQGERKRAIEAASVVLESTYVITNRMVAEIWIQKAFLVRSEIEMRNLLLETGEKT